MSSPHLLNRSFDPASRGLLARFRAVRAETEARAAPLSPEDQQIQSMPDCSPAKWHRAHTTWFFETFILAGEAGYRPFDPAFSYLFNSYYEAVGARHPRPERGMLTRPSAETIGRYRAHVDAAMAALLQKDDLPTDIKHAFSLNPLKPAYREAPEMSAPLSGRAGWVELPPGIYEAGMVDEG